ncbi:MAG: AI-2E family transporter [Patulibacter sp.]|nr:AI-2E family transporter [Patulibacter sp.]
MPGRNSIPRTVLQTTLTILAVLASLGLIYLLRGPISWIILAGFLAVAVSGPVTVLSRRLPRSLAIALVYIGVLLFPALILLVILPPIVNAAADLIDQAPEYAASLEKTVNENETLQQLDDDFGIVEQIQKQADQLPARLGDAANWLGDLGLGIVNSAFAAVTIVIFSIFLVVNGRRWLDRILVLSPVEHADRLRGVLDRMGQAVGSYIAGALFQALVAGILTWIVLTILDVPFAAPLAVLVGLFDLIPMVGATIAAVIVGIVTLFYDFPTVTIVWVIWSIVYQQVENTVIQPRIQKRAVGVHPFLVMVSVLCGGTLLGVPGALLAVPVAASIQIGIHAWWEWRTEQRRMLDVTVHPAGDDDDGPSPSGNGPSASQTA